MNDVSELFKPLSLGAIDLDHRVVHAPTTRLRAEADDSPSPMMVEYYRQRASAGGLLITESAHPSLDSCGYLGAPGIYTAAHTAAWAKITDAVHANGGKIVMQIAHDGRQSHVELSEGRLPVAPSVVPFETQVLTHNGWVPNSPHRALAIEEIQLLVESFRLAAQRALDLAYLHIIEPRVKGTDENLSVSQQPVAAATLRKIYRGPIIAAGGFDRVGANAMLQRGDADAIAFGRWFTSNPDLPERLRHGVSLTPYRREAFWGGSKKDYIDFPYARELQNA